MRLLTGNVWRRRFRRSCVRCEGSMGHLVAIIRMRYRSLFARRAAERDLDEELQYHLDRQIDENLALGLSPREAKWAALRSMGDFEQRKEECRDQRGLKMFDNVINDIRL